MATAMLTGCFSSEKAHIPKEGEIVVWKQNPQLIVKAKLGPRRQHIPDQFDSEFYRPAREHYLGQFPIGYVPEKFAPITQGEAESLPMPDSNRQLQFDLNLSDLDFQATDGYLPDHDDQVRVRIEGLTMDMRAEHLDTYKTYLQRKEYFKENSKFEKYGLTCYQKKVADNFYGCYGKSKKYDVTGVLLDVIALENTADNRFIQIRGDSYEPNKYGGIWVKWETNLNNWDRWQEIDSAIWRLLDAWNTTPLKNNSK